MKSRPKRRRRGVQDGVFKKRGWWWLDYSDQDGKRRREKAAPDYETAKALYRQKMTKLARGEITGIREEGMWLGVFVEKVWWPRLAPRLAPVWATRVRLTLDSKLLPRFGGTPLAMIQKDALAR